MVPLNFSLNVTVVGLLKFSFLEIHASCSHKSHLKYQKHRDFLEFSQVLIPLHKMEMIGNHIFPQDEGIRSRNFQF